MLGGMFKKAANVDAGFEIQKSIQLSGTEDAPLPQMDLLAGRRELDAAQYPGAEFFSDATAFLAVDGVVPDERSTAAAGALRAMMGSAGQVAAAVAELQQAATTVAATLGKVGAGFESATGGLAPSGAAFTSVGAGAVPPLAQGLAAVQAQAEGGAREVDALRVAATERQTKFAQFEQVRQEVLQLLAKPNRGVGAVAKMQLKDEGIPPPAPPPRRSRCLLFSRSRSPLNPA